MADFAYRGIPIEQNGVVVAVQRVRSIEAADGRHYRGVLAYNARGEPFVYNKYPNTGVQPVKRLRLKDSLGRGLNDASGRELYVKGAN